MNQIIKQEEVESKIIKLQGIAVILDSEVAELYGVQTRRINEAVKNNPEKFPDGYIIELTQKEKNELVENFDRFESLKHSTALPKAFTEKGLYMLATILKSKRATETTLTIIDTFTKAREITRMVKEMPKLRQDSPHYKDIMRKTGELISDLVVPNDLEATDSEASVELNLAVVKFKYSVKKKAK